MFKCRSCKTNKFSTEFYKDKKSSTGLRGECKECEKKRVGRNITPAHKRKRKTISARPTDGMTLVRKANYIDQRKETTPCASCGCYDHPKAMDYHHLDERQKLFQLSQIRRMRTNDLTFEMVVDEIQKCILLCATCHRKLHANVLCLMG